MLCVYGSPRCLCRLSSLILLSCIHRFKCLDLDGNGVLTPNELQYFYEEQLHRMECMAQEPVLFEDILCQIVDMIAPEVKNLVLSNTLESSSFCVSSHLQRHLLLQREGCITLSDLKGCKLSGNVFNILFNLNKFVAFESRDPFLIRQVHSAF